VKRKNAKRGESTSLILIYGAKIVNSPSLEKICTVPEFDLLNTPLKGHILIEASAGTGKTYTISRLFLRLLLEKELPNIQPNSLKNEGTEYQTNFA